MGEMAKGNSSGNSGFSQSVFLQRIGFSINRQIPFRFSLYLSFEIRHDWRRSRRSLSASIC